MKKKKKEILENEFWKYNGRNLSCKIKGHTTYWLPGYVVNDGKRFLGSLNHLCEKLWISPKHLYSLLELLDKNDTYAMYLSKLYCEGPYFKGWRRLNSVFDEEPAALPEADRR